VHVAERVALQAGQSVGILGCGSIGGLFSAVSKRIGAGPIIAADVHQHCLDNGCRRLGVDHGFLLPNSTLGSNIMEITAGEGLDVVAVCADDPSLFHGAMEIVSKRGTVIVVALLNEQALQFMAYSIIQKEASILGTYSGNINDFQRAIQLAGSQQVDVASIVTHRLPVEQAQMGFRLARTKEDGAIKVVLTFA
jgi:threonine dehydrogenase-like Zn-dependent dehydrogenase